MTAFEIVKHAPTNQPTLPQFRLATFKSIIMKSDAQIQKDVLAQLRWEPFLHAVAIGVTVKNGIVTLSGIVDSFPKKIAAEKAAKKVSGVRAVVEDIQVGLSPDERKTEAEIAAVVLNALKTHVLVPDKQLQIRIEEGIVTLEGEVEWEYQRTLAQNAVENLAGLRNVYNNITIKPKISPQNIKEKISAAFQRSATIDAARIKIEVSESKITLRGKVCSFSEWEDADNAAWSAPGVTIVDNQLELDPVEAFRSDLSH